MKVSWRPAARDYKLEESKYAVDFVNTNFHPLLHKDVLKDVISGKTASKAEEKEVKTEMVAKPAKPAVLDPLQMMAAQAKSKSKAVANPLMAGNDPLSMMLKGSPAKSGAEPKRRGQATRAGVLGDDSDVFLPEHEVFQTWKSKTPAILATYTTSKRVAVRANFMDGGEQKGDGEQTKRRLDEIETASGVGGDSKLMMTQNEAIAHLEEQHSRLKKAWEMGERVLSLRIVIQCAKMLGDTKVPNFYPSKYVLLAAMLDTFGDLVFDRVKKLSVPDGGHRLPDNFTSSMVSANGKETCKNWFFKAACIRELMPRLFIDLALIKSYRFLSDTDFSLILSRLSRTIRGVGDPLVAMYARCYLTNKARQLCTTFSPKAVGPDRPLPTSFQKVVLESYDDVIFILNALAKNQYNDVNHVSEGSISVDEYLVLFSPALDWILGNLGFGGHDDLFYALIEQYKQYFPNTMVLLYILQAFNPRVISLNALMLVELIKSSETNEKVPASKLYLALGRALVASTPPKSQQLPILNQIWKVVAKIADPDEYLEVAEVFVQFLICCFTDREVNIFLQDVIKHVRKASTEQVQSQKFQTILSNIVVSQMEFTKDLLKTLGMGNFLSLMDLLHNASKVPVAKVVLTKFKQTGLTISDPVVIHTLMDVAASLHDSLDAQTFEDERRQITVLLINLVRKIDFDRDLEQQLNAFADCRSAFTKLDDVAEELVMQTSWLCVRAMQFMKGKHTKKTRSFVKACLAYCHITIPSLDSHVLQLRLYVHCGEIGMQNGLVMQSEAFFKAAVALMKDIPASVEVDGKTQSTEAELEGFAMTLANVLLMLPGHPKHGPFYLVQGLINSVSQYQPWAEKVTPAKTRVFLGLLQLFCAYFQRNFIHKIQGLESNDVLYGGAEAQYMEPLRSMLDFLVTQIVEQIQALKGENMVDKLYQSEVALKTINIFLSHFEINKNAAMLIVKLWQVVVDTGKAADANYVANTKLHLHNKRGTWYRDIEAEVAKLT
jgi:hypothetical protein